jgi:hypothetical protein
MALIGYYKDWKHRNPKEPKNNGILILLDIVALVLTVSTIRACIK